MSEKIRGAIDKSPRLREYDESTKEAIAKFVETIAPLQERWVIHGHGVDNEAAAQSVEQQGLYTRWTTLQDFSYPLKSNEQLLAEQVTSWNYEGRQYIVLIAVPKHENYVATDVADEGFDAHENRAKSRAFAAEHVFEPATLPEGVRGPLGSDKRIPPARIIGYWDNKTRRMHLNPNWSQ